MDILLIFNSCFYPASQILESWRSKRVIDPQKIDDVVAVLSARSSSASDLNPSQSTSLPSPLAHSSSRPSSSHHHSSHQAVPRQEIFRRIEEDRERHKRLRERRWVQPVSHKNPQQYHTSFPQLASFMPMTDDGDGEEELTIDIEFENEWETTSDWNEDDDDAVGEENDLCFPGEGEITMDMS